jgi:hypothetical protein
LCLGNAEAMDFLANHWARYCHEIDDIIDGERADPQAIIGTFARAIYVYTHPFFLKHMIELRAIALVVTSLYAQSVRWEKSEKGWQRQWADHHRHVSNLMVSKVAEICGGYEHEQAVVPELHEYAYHEHHDLEGNAN